MRSVTLIIFFLVTLTGYSSACSQGKVLTSYATQLIDKIRPEKELRLPQRSMGDVILSSGKMEGFESMKLIDSPVNLFCHNDTIGALQMKFKATNVRVSYDWLNSDNSAKGRATLPPQDVYLDIDIEKDRNSLHPESLGVYMGRPANDNFDVQVTKMSKRVTNIEEIGFHVLMTSKMAFGRDARLALIYAIAPPLEEFLEATDFSID